MLRAVADIHAVIWYLHDDQRLSDAARIAFETAAASGDAIGFSALTLAEILYLGEKGRIHPEVFGRLLVAIDRPGVVLWPLPFDRSVAEAIPRVDRDRVPDLPERIIAATALLHGVPLIGRDRRIRVSGLATIW